ncbi:MAG: TonB-dependent receptor [Bacteroidetes bacterium]|nr:TonB-dependent receptor [Bacteroidota bacterium]
MPKFFLILVLGIGFSANPTQAELVVALQQDNPISGTVKDSNGDPLVGSTVIVKGTSLGTIVDIDGNYRLAVPSDAETLIYSYVGMIAQEIQIGGRSVIDVLLLADATSLAEVVVVGYATQKKVNLTGAVATIESAELVKIPAPNISTMLTGQAPGLLSQQTQGVPGDDETLLSIRGYDSPLVLVDGIQMDWNRLDASEIESISVLKDAAAAIYGSRAGNGVILITTKRGASGKPTISFSSTMSFQEPTNLPNRMDSWKYAELLREGEFNQGLAYTYSEADVQTFKSGNDPDFPNTNWHEETFRHWAPMQSHNINVRGGSDAVKYFISGGYLDQGSLYQSGDLNFNRYNARSNVDAQITENLSATVDLAFRREARDSPQTDLGTNWNDINIARPEWPAHLPNEIDTDGDGIADEALGGAYAGFNLRTPLAQTQKKWTGFIDDKRDYLTGKIGLTYKIPGIEGLVASANLNYMTSTQYKKTQDIPFEVLDYRSAGDTGGDIRSGYDSFGFNGQNTLDEEQLKTTQLYPMITLNYNTTIGDHYISGLLLAEAIDTEEIFFTARKIDLLSTDLPFLFAGSPDNVSANGFTNEQGRQSYAGRLNYNFKGKYLFEATFRSDASHKFPKNSRWGFFPSFSVGWNIAEEDFMQSLSFVDNLKLRASYSQAGDDNVAAFKYLTGYRIRDNSDDNQNIRELQIFGDQVFRMITSTGLPNESITWLEMTSYNVGLDGSFLNGLIGFEFDVFKRNVDNVFGEPLDLFPSTFGAILPQLNINSTDNRGFELTLTHRKKISNDFEYSVGGSFTKTREKYTDWAESPFDDDDEKRVFGLEGNWTNRRIGYLSDGIFMDQSEIDSHPTDQDQAGNVTLRPGDIRYKDLNGDGEINFRDQDVIGFGSYPDIVFSFNMAVNYKGIGLSALFQGASRFDHYNQIHPFSNFSNPWDFHEKYRWTPNPDSPGQNINSNAKLPALLGDGVGRSPNSDITSDFWVQDATYIRLKNLNISYSLPGSLLEGLGIEALQVNLAGSNLFTASNLGMFKKSIDPEAIGGNGLFYPPVKVIALGINLTL